MEAIRSEYHSGGLRRLYSEVIMSLSYYCRKITGPFLDSLPKVNLMSVSFISFWDADSAVSEVSYQDVCHVTFPSLDSSRRYPKCDQSTMEKTMDCLCNVMFASVVSLAAISNFQPDYNRTFAALLLLEFYILLIRKVSNWCQGYFDDMLDENIVGSLGLFVTLWTTNHDHVSLILNMFYVGCRVILYARQVLPYSIQLLIGSILLKFLRVKNRRDRYEDLGFAGLLPCNEAVNLSSETLTDGYYYSLERNHLAKSCNEAGNETARSIAKGRSNSSAKPDVETLLDGSRAPRKLGWKIGTMMISYSDDYEWVTIMQKAEDRAVKTYMETFTGDQKSNFIRMMNAWEERPEQGILENVVGGRTNWHCLTLAQLIQLTKQYYSVCKIPTDLASIKVGAEVDAIVEGYSDYVRKRVGRLQMSFKRLQMYRRVIQVFFVVTCSALLLITLRDPG